MASLKDQILQGFKNAGLSLNQARIITAEVGRENSFNPDVVFGIHPDPRNGKSNVGMLSWQNGREIPLIKSLTSNGLIENGKIKNDQKAIDLMARYAIHEIKTKPEYAATKKQFLENPDVPYKDAAKVLGQNFIRWRFNDPEFSSGHTNRDEFYAQLGGNPARNDKERSNQQQNTYQKVKASFQQEQSPTIAKVYDAYRAGKLNAQQKSDFESDVKAGKIMLPEGGQLIGKSKPQPITLPQSISDAYANGKLSMQQRSDLESDIKSGKVKLPVASKNKTSLPEFDQNNTIVQQPTEQGILPPQAPEPTLGQKIIGAGETAMTLGTGAVTAPIASVFGTLGQAGTEIAGGNFGTPEAAQRIALAAQQAGQDYTYQPRTEAGLQDLQAVGDVLSPLESLPPVMGGLGVQTATLGRAAVPQAVTAAQRTAQAAAPVIGG